MASGNRHLPDAIVAALVLVACKSHVAEGAAEASVVRESTNESVDAAVVTSADGAALEPLEAAVAEASATRVTRWRIAYERKGESGGFVTASRTSVVLSDDGSFRSLFWTHATRGQVHAAQALLDEMREHGQISTSRPRDPAAGCANCAHTEIRVTLDGEESFVDLTAVDPADPPLTVSLGQHHIVWKNERAVRLETLIESIGPEREGRVTVTGKLSAEVIKRVVREGTQSRTCYVDADRHGLAGSVTVRFVIDRTGSVSSSAQDPEATKDISDTTLVECVAHGFRSLVFPRPEDDVTVVYQTVFTP